MNEKMGLATMTISPEKYYGGLMESGDQIIIAGGSDLRNMPK